MLCSGRQAEQRAPTESNLVTSLVVALENRGYAAFTEVPFSRKRGNGRIDLVAIHKDRREMILFEAKSDKPSDSKLEDEVKRDWTRLTGFDLKDLPDNGAWVNAQGGLRKQICVGFWSEVRKKIEGDRLFIDLSSEATPYREWIGDGINIGVKFFHKSM